MFWQNRLTTSLQLLPYSWFEFWLLCYYAIGLLYWGVPEELLILSCCPFYLLSLWTHWSVLCLLKSTGVSEDCVSKGFESWLLGRGWTYVSTRERGWSDCPRTIPWLAGSCQINTWTVGGLLAQICSIWRSKGHVGYVGGEIKEGKDNLAKNKTASVSGNWHFVFKF